MHFSKIQLSSLSFILLALLTPICPPAQADTTKAACETQKGTCKETCDTNDYTGQGLCSDLVNSGTYCCIPKESAPKNTEGTATEASQNPSYNYTLLETIPGIDSKNLSFTSYLSAIYKLAIWIVGLCALFMFLVGAFMYMLSAANTSKAGTAKGIMTDALIGLVLALASYLILYVINPDLINLRLPSVSMPTTSAPSRGGTAPSAAISGNVYTQSEAEQKLSGANISVSSSGGCSDPANAKCTSLQNIPKTTIDNIISLKNGTGCPVTVTGGTETGHSAHGSGKPVVDVSENSCLEGKFSQTKPPGYNIAKICADGNSQAAAYNCGSYIEAAPHFHLQFNN